jgi:hypothetical protein
VDQAALLELARKHLIRYASEFAPFVVSRAEGSWIWDQDGNKYQRATTSASPIPSEGAGTSVGVGLGIIQFLLGLNYFGTLDLSRREFLGGALRAENGCCYRTTPRSALITANI